MNSPPTQHGQWMGDEFEKDLVSVIVPTYNRAYVLPEALDSVWAQTYRPIELIVIDDGSTDHTDMVVERWCRRHQGDDQFELRYFRQENSGAPSARNLGLIQSKGEYIQFLDSDDLLYPEMLSHVCQAFNETHCDLVHVGYEKICAECGKYIRQYVPEVTSHSAIAAYMTGKIWGHTSSLVRRRHLAQMVGPWNESLPIDQDGDYMCRTILRSPKMEIVQERLFAYMVRPIAKINDIRHSSEALQFRFQREALFCEGIQNKKDFPLHAKKAYAGFLYTRAVQLCGAGFTDIGNGYGKLAEGIQTPTLSRYGQRMRGIWKSGRFACQAYRTVSRFKKELKNCLVNAGPKSGRCSCCGR